MANRNTLYADIVVDELARAGLKTVCLAPGSRNTPLVMAFAKHPAITVYSHLDERSAAFFALGIGLATGTPSAVVCTSGTAVANFFPAVIEATQSGIPLLVISADRPPELRDSGANQTIDQVKIFGDYPLWAVDLPTPEAEPSALTIRYVRSIANRAVATTMSIRKGVVHINMPFRKPLEPIPVPQDITTIPTGALARGESFPYIVHHHPTPKADDGTIHQLRERITSTQHVLIICGTHCPPTLAEPLHHLAQHFPVIVDGASGLRLQIDNTITAYDTFLNMPHTLPVPDVVMRLGYVPTSNWLNAYLDSLPAHVQRVHIHENGVWADDTYRTDWFIHADPTDCLLRVMDDLMMPSQPSDFYTAWQAIERATWEALASELADTWFDGAIVHRAVNLLPTGSVLFAGNSLPIRHLDQFGRGMNKGIHAHGIRGASGIDGNISVALGLGAGYGDTPLCAIVGDITAYHDMNGLLAVRRCGIPITLVVLNNDGGGIFHRLPIAQFEPEFTEYFLTPHGLQFQPVAELYGLAYANPTTFAEFDAVFTESIHGRKSTLIEIKTDSHADFEARKALLARVRSVVMP
jgi:2-succinyl-5-enolpyruvyl-6-hydroxy-3-cyclohexene-1-carboxylate synthase